MRRGAVTETSPLAAQPHAPAWYEAVSLRRSRRTFESQPVADGLLDELGGCCSSLRPFEDARVELIRAPGIDVFRGLVGSYGKVTGAPHLLVVIAGNGPLAQQHAGYIGEVCILEATRLGLDTCWVGGFFDRARVSTLIALSDVERVVAVSPVGHAAATHSTSERSLESFAGSHARKPLSTLVEGEIAEWPEWARHAAECARLAPSATNRQPWRFWLEGSAFVIATNRGPELPLVTKRLDCGIAMAHAELGALSAGARFEWSESTGGREVARLGLLGKDAS